jgi:hypothetical protein
VIEEFLNYDVTEIGSLVSARVEVGEEIGMGRWAME